MHIFRPQFLISCHLASKSSSVADGLLLCRPLLGAKIPLSEQCDQATDVCNDTNAYCNKAVCECRPGYAVRDLNCGRWQTDVVRSSH